MSAFFVEPETIRDVVTVWIRYAKRPIDADALGRQLWQMNADAVFQRYDHLDEALEERRESYAEAATFRWTPSNQPLAQLAKSVDCLVYQCTEGNVPDRIEFQALLALADRIPVDREGGDYKAASWSYWEKYRDGAA